MAEGTTQLTDPAEMASPLFFGDYEVLKSIGKGKFAIVYRAKKIGDEQVVALKRIAVDMMNEKAREKCLKEVRLLQSLDHPNIIRYMDSFITENDLVIVYEWAAAGDLKRQLRKAQERGTGFEERVIWKYFSQICNAMKHMHDKRIMHRDLKPANIFLTLDGTIKVGDLGLSRELSEHTVQAHSKVGTPLYMSPEVLKGEGYDFKSDVWSLGCLLYELAMLKSPFKSEGLNLYSLFQKISNGEYQPLPENYSEELRTLTYAMISTMPEDRPEISYVCKVAQELRTLTADKSSRSRKNSAGSVAAGSVPTAASATGMDSRPNSGLPARQDSVTSDKAVAETKVREGADRRDSAGLKRDTDSPGRQTRKNFTEPALSLTRQGSFKLERVNYEDVDADMKNEEKDRDGRLGSGQGRRAAHANSNSSSRASSGRRRGGSASSNPRDMSFEREEEDEDEATVKLGQAEYFGEGPARGSELRERGVVVLGSDASPVRNLIQPELTVRPNSDRSLFGEEDNEEMYRKARGEEMRVRAADQVDSLVPPSRKKIDRSEMKSSSDNIVLEKNREKSQSNVAGNPYRRMRAEGSDAAVAATAPSSGSLPERSGSRGEAKSRHKTGGGRSDSRGEDRLNVIVSMKSTTQELRVQGKTLEEHLQDSSVAFAVMETVYCKLVALGCPLEDPDVKAEFRSKDWSSRGRLLPMHFACDLQIFPQVAGHDAGYRFLQFRRFVHVASWLCSCIGGTAANAVSRMEPEQEAPVMTAKQILRAAQAACGETEKLPIEIADISPTSLTPGHGINVCQLLSFLADAALRSTRFTPQSLQYDTGGAEGFGNAQEGGFQVAEGDEEELEDEVEVDRSDDQRHAGSLLRVNGEASMSLEESATSPRSSSRHVFGASMMLGVIDPAQWKAETERVAVKLAAHRINSAHMGVGAEWADHVDAMRKYTAKYSSDTDINDSSRRTGSRLGDATASTVPKVMGSLERIRDDLASSLAKVRSLEVIINKLGNVPQSTMLFSSVQMELDMQEKRATEVRMRISGCSTQLSELQDRYEEASEAVRTRAGAGGEDGAGGAVVKLKASLQLIKTEIKDMSTNIALLSNSLLCQRQVQAAVTRQKLQKKSAQRRQKGGEADVSMENVFLDD